ncbi:hypothetical protein D8B26_000286 [Coccidioides posadasii str. Silveira]|uniref:Probable E3 ubiquitin ligase complex SCF subunit sconB n=1 Tax=Coccidioides posadasii (strain RMSCC 757 / Silveira) TaxID=443226 RepID=E9D894_COCPS|nr:sulfur metabolite repression control protein [Coccidioides posadasii str. Silveira]QVM05580.1 hypothetical protein D8B26_000286 [Coccidioides posadasii str. Silveira]
MASNSPPESSSQSTFDTCAKGDFQESPRKRRRLSIGFSVNHEPSASVFGPSPPGNPTQESRDYHAVSDVSVAGNTQLDLPERSIAPFLTKHIRDQHAVMNQFEPLAAPSSSRNPNSRYCYRHRPDLKCRRQADEITMDQMQRELHTLSQNDQRSIAHFWALFSAAPSKHRNLMLRGILAQCCFPQLSFLSASVRDLIRIDFLTALPPEISFKILCCLDTASLCKAAQVSRRWRDLADDDVVWHRMCEQHIDRKCKKCGWGLPILDRKRLRDSRRQIQLRATGKDSDRKSATPEAMDADEDYFKTKYRPWKDVYRDRFKVGINWKHGRCTTKIFRGHSNGVMCLQFEDNILATGSYDTTIKIWDTDTGEELRTLHGHQSGIRCLQFDDTKLISGSLDRTIKVWNWRTGECISTYTGHHGGVICLHFDATTLASGSMDNTVKIWNFHDKSTRILRGHADWINSVKIDSLSRTVFTASDDLTVRLWDLDTGNCIHTYAGHVGQVQQVVLLPREFEFEEHDGDDTRSITSTGTSTELEHEHHHHDHNDPEETSLSAPFSLPMSPAFDALFAKDRPAPPRYMVTAALDSTLRLWEVPTGRCLRTFFGHIEGVWALGADTLRIVSGAQDHMTKVWCPRTGRCERTFTGHTGPVTCIGLSDSRLATGSEDSEVRMYSFRC